MKTPTTRIWKQMFDQGKLNDVQSQFWKPHPAEELYDLEADPEETKNLANDPNFAEVMERFRREQKLSYLKFGDLGLIPEATIKSIDDSGSSPRTILNNSQSFPLDQILEIAKAAADRSDRGREAWGDAIESSNPTIAYWGCIGALLDGRVGYDAAANTIVKRVGDANPSVAIAASELVSKFGNSEQAKVALDRLLYYSDYRNSNVLGAVAALNAIDRLGEKADSIRDSLDSLPRVDPKFKRGKDYIGRLLDVVSGKGK